MNRRNPPSPAARKCAPRLQQCKKRSCYFPIVRLVRAIVSYIWLRDSVKTFVAVDYFIRAPSQSARQSLLSTSRSRPMRVSRGFSLCRDPSANAGAEDLVALESAQAFHFFLKGTLSSERYSRLRLLASERQRRIVILRSFVASFLVRDRRTSLSFHEFERPRDGTKCVSMILTNQEIGKSG